MKKTFEQGYVCAACNLIREFDQPTMAASLLSSLGKIDYSMIDSEDLDILNKHNLLPNVNP